MLENNISSINCSGLDFFEGAVDFDDLAFLNMVLSMQQSDQALAAKMSEIRTLNDIKKSISRQLGYLNKSLSRSSAEKPNDYVYVEGGLDDPSDPEKGRFKSGDEQRTFEESVKDAVNLAKITGVKVSGVFEHDGNAYASVQHLDHGKVPTDQELHENGIYRKKEVEAKIEELRGKLEDLNSDSSVMMIDLQRLMNKRNQITQMVSNIEAKSHQTAMSVIANLK